MVLWAVVGDPCSLLPLQAVASFPITPTSLEALPVSSLTLDRSYGCSACGLWMSFAVTATVSPFVGMGQDVAAWQRPCSEAKEALGMCPQQASIPPQQSGAPCDLQAVQGAGCDPCGCTVPTRGLGFIQEGQRDMARKWSNPSPAAGRARVTKPNGARPAERSRHGDPRSPFKVPEDEGMWQHPLEMVPQPSAPAEAVLSEQWWQHQGAENSAGCCRVQGLIPAARAD